MKLLFYYPSSCSPEPEPPIGLGILMAIGRSLGHEIRFFDHDLHAARIDLHALLEEFNPDIFAVSSMTPQYYFAQSAIRFVKKRNASCVTVLGGNHASSLPVQTLQELPELDYLCAGEGEKTFAEFLSMIQSGRPEQIDGLFHRHRDEIVVPAPRALMSSEELDQLPNPAWEIMLEHGCYREKINYVQKPVDVFAVITSRGCPFECTFCDEGTLWKRRVRSRRISTVVSEIRFLIDRYGARHFNLLDDTFTLAPRRVKEFCDAVRSLNINYRITAHVNTVTPDLLNDLASSGCKLVAFGVESGDQGVLDAMKKRQTLDTVRRAFEMTNRTGMMSYALCMVGNIGEDFTAVKRTESFVKAIGATLFSVAVMTPYPGSVNYETCTRNGWLLHKDWKRWTPSPIRQKKWEPVARTDKMDRKQIVKAYYYLSRRFMYIRFRRKYGQWYWANLHFWRAEVAVRLKSIGPVGLLRHAYRLIGINDGSL
jgi:anaerobic magnesium-protoporphyrin IX monomethyl ester cyclase